MAAAVRAALDQLPPVALDEAETRLDEAHQVLQNAVGGSNQPDIGQAVAKLAEARQHLADVRSLTQRTRALLEGYLGRVAGRSTTVAAATAPIGRAGPPVASSGPRKQERPPPPPDVLALLGDLPTKVPKPNPDGRKTYGKVLGTRPVK
ncbi:hypothetical protein [Actinokineospora pegani]|uniref:hypothetical protein n=1 Tax=Actinokineospora pegani TaxID=2654637 RepID=UPI0012E9D948|nr:hypothetical protein [Actinokineospora pegani]